MAARPAFAKAYKSLVEKPGESTHSAKFDRCVEHVKGQGVDNPYAVCMAQLGDEAFKSADNGGPDYEKEIDLFMQKLGISGAGPVPNSLLARQDLEGKKSGTRKSFAMVYKSMTKPTVEKSEKKVQKAGDKCYVVRFDDPMNPGMGPVNVRWDKKEDAERHLQDLMAQGKFAVLVEESIVSSSAEKGQVETTGKQLDRAVSQAAKAETDDEKETVADKIKNIQIKRQKATIAARTKEAAGKSFKDVWGTLSRN